MKNNHKGVFGKEQDSLVGVVLAGRICRYVTGTTIVYFILFGGSPDLIDAIIYWLMNNV